MNEQFTTNELAMVDKAKVFALYLDQKVQRISDGEIMNIAGVDIFDGGVTCAATYDSVDANYYDFDDVRILLRLIANMPDEHAQEVAKILNVSYGNQHSDEDFFDLSGMVDFLECLFEKGNTERCEPSRLFYLYQFLVSNGYAVPLLSLGGINAVKAGLAIATS